MMKIPIEFPRQLTNSYFLSRALFYFEFVAIFAPWPAMELNFGVATVLSTNGPAFLKHQTSHRTVRPPTSQDPHCFTI